jgi:hypothetical protein
MTQLGNEGTAKKGGGGIWTGQEGVKWLSTAHSSKPGANRANDASGDRKGCGSSDYGSTFKLRWLVFFPQSAIGEA